MAFNGTNLRTHECSFCHKFRLYLPLGESPSGENEIKELPNGEKMAFPKQVCDWCKIKIYKKYFEPKPADIKKVLKALKEGRSEQSLEDLL